MADIQLIKNLCEAFGPTGLEDEVTSIIFKNIQSITDASGYTPLGGVWGLIKGTGEEPTKLIGCGIDEVSFMVGDIDDNGFVRPKKLTKYNSGTVCAKKVTVGNESIKLDGIMSAKVLHLASGNERENPNVEKCFVDLGFSKKEDLEEKIQKGDFITFNEQVSKFGKNKLYGKCLSNRVGAALMIEYARYLKDKGITPKSDIILFFGVKEKVGMSDLFYAVQHFAPKSAMILSALPACNCEKESNCKLGNGIALPTHDGYSLYFGNDIYTSILKSDIKYQVPKNTEEHQSSAKAQYAGVGCEMFKVSLPVRNIYSSGEIISLSDVEEMEKVIKFFG